MLKRVMLKTCVVVGRREARTVEAMRAALVDREAGNLGLGQEVLSRLGLVADLLCFDTGAVVECKDADDDQPRAYCPDGIG